VCERVETLHSPLERGRWMQVAGAVDLLFRRARSRWPTPGPVGVVLLHLPLPSFLEQVSYPFAPLSEPRVHAPPLEVLLSVDQNKKRVSSRCPRRRERTTTKKALRERKSEKSPLRALPRRAPPGQSDLRPARRPIPRAGGVFEGGKRDNKRRRPRHGGRSRTAVAHGGVALRPSAVFACSPPVAGRRRINTRRWSRRSSG